MSAKQAKRRGFKVRDRRSLVVSQSEGEAQELLEANRALLDKYAEAAGCPIVREVSSMSVAEGA